MKRIQTNYEQFILENEAAMSDQTKGSLVNTFLAALDQAAGAAFAAERSGTRPWNNREVKDASYSTLAINIKQQRDFKSDFYAMQAEMNKAGWTSERIEKLFSSMGPMVLEAYENGYNQSGVADNFLYHYDDKALLAGYDFTEPAEEAVIKFMYGWHKTSYGTAALAQQFGSAEKFIDDVMSEHLKTALVYNEYGSFSEKWKNEEWGLEHAEFDVAHDELSLVIMAENDKDAIAAAQDICGINCEILGVIPKKQSGIDIYEVKIQMQ